MQGIPEYDRHLTDIEKAETEAEVRNATKEATRNHRLTAGQKEELVKAAQLKIAVVNMSLPVEHYTKDGLTTIDAQKGGGADSALTSHSAKEDAPALQTLTEVEVVEEPRPELAMILPRFSAQAMSDAIDAWAAVAKAIERPEDICMIEGRPYRRVSFWRKVGMAYHIGVKELSVASVSANPIYAGTPSAQIHLRLSATSGRAVEAVGLANGREKRFFSKKQNAWLETTEHGIVALAWTRAYCRAMRVLVGFGEPSAEEVEADA